MYKQKVYKIPVLLLSSGKTAFYICATLTLINYPILTFLETVSLAGLELTM